jgi:hypothetical protein
VDGVGSAPNVRGRWIRRGIGRGRLLRDAKFFSIGFGTNEIRRIVIGRDLLTIKVTAALLTRKRRPERGGIADSLLSQSEIFDIRDLPLRIPFFSYSILFGLGRPL